MLVLTDVESEVCCFLALSERMNSREPLPRLDWRLTSGTLLQLGESPSAVFLRRRALWRCRRARQLRLSPSKEVRSWKRPHCWQKRWRLPSLMMLLTCGRDCNFSAVSMTLDFAPLSRLSMRASLSADCLKFCAFTILCSVQLLALLPASPAMPNNYSLLPKPGRI